MMRKVRVMVMVMVMVMVKGEGEGVRENRWTHEYWEGISLKYNM